jgi:uncharacterized protein (DUF433 family)
MGEKDMARHIVRTPLVLGGAPRIVGRRIGVEHIVNWYKEQRMAPKTIADEYGLELAAVYAALAYYYDNQEEIDALIEESNRLWEEGWKAQQQDPVYQSMKARMEAYRQKLAMD